MLARVSDRS